MFKILQNILSFCLHKVLCEHIIISYKMIPVHAHIRILRDGKISIKIIPATFFDGKSLADRLGSWVDMQLSYVQPQEMIYAFDPNEHHLHSISVYSVEYLLASNVYVKEISSAEPAQQVDIEIINNNLEVLIRLLDSSTCVVLEDVMNLPDVLQKNPEWNVCGLTCDL
jgi:hypothetical protein